MLEQSLDAYAGGYDPERYRRPYRNESRDWAVPVDNDEEDDDGEEG